MKNNLKNAVVMLLTLAVTAYASPGVEAGKNSLLLWIFLAFAGLIIVFQLIPGLTLFTAMIKSLFFTPSQETELLVAGKNKK